MIWVKTTLLGPTSGSLKHDPALRRAWGWLRTWPGDEKLLCTAWEERDPCRDFAFKVDTLSLNPHSHDLKSLTYPVSLRHRRISPELVTHHCPRGGQAGSCLNIYWHFVLTNCDQFQLQPGFNGSSLTCFQVSAVPAYFRAKCFFSPHSFRRCVVKDRRRPWILVLGQACVRCARRWTGPAGWKEPLEERPSCCSWDWLAGCLGAEGPPQTHAWNVGSM